MENVFQFARDMDEFADIVVIEFELFQFEEVFDIPKVTGDQVIHADDMVAFGNESVTQM